MTKIELMQKLAEIPGDYPIVFLTPTDEILEEYYYMYMTDCVVDGVKEIYRTDEMFFDDFDELFDHIAADYCGDKEGAEADAEIEKIAKAVPRETKIVIRVSS